MLTNILNKKTLNIKTLFILIPFMFGLFYDYTVFAVAIMFLGIILATYIKNKKINIYYNYFFISMLILSMGSLFTSIWAVDKQDAIFGFFRIFTVLLFTIILMQKEKEEIKEYYTVIPLSGIVMVIICIIIRFIPSIVEYFYSGNGRLGGFFQYSNTFALFLLIGIIVLMYSDKKIKYKLLQIAILLIGILLTGSRTVFLLTILAYIIYLFAKQERKEKIKTFSILGVMIIASIIVVVVTNNFTTIGRFLTISLNSSTLWGRIIYYKDALVLLKDNILGYGYMGYSYMYPTVQTANYAVKFVHNDFLQLALDYGIIPTITFIIAFCYSIFSKKTDKMQKIILIIMFFHMMIDFDLQFLVMFLVLVSMQDLSKQRKFEMQIKKSILVFIILIALMLGYGYLGIATFANYIDKNDIAISMLSNYTEAKTGLLRTGNEISLNRANTIANKILESNSNVVVAYNIKAMYELEMENYEKACLYKEKAITLNKYNSQEYEDYVVLLSKILDNTIRARDKHNTNKYINKVLEIESIIEKTKENTTGLASKIRDDSNIELNEQTKKYINNIKGVVGK